MFYAKEILNNFRVMIKGMGLDGFLLKKLCFVCRTSLAMEGRLVDVLPRTQPNIRMSDITLGRSRAFSKNLDSVVVFINSYVLTRITKTRGETTTQHNFIIPNNYII